LKWGDEGLPLSRPAVIARARTLPPNSTTATKLLPLLLHDFFVRCWNEIYVAVWARGVSIETDDFLWNDFLMRFLMPGAL
jgi:hypothetical protein